MLSASPLSGNCRNRAVGREAGCRVPGVEAVEADAVVLEDAARSEGRVDAADDRTYRLRARWIR